MSFHIEKLSDPTVILCTMTTTSIYEDLPLMTAELATVLASEPERLFVIYDAHGVKTGLDDIMKTATAATQGQSAMLNHPKIREILVVSTDRLITMGAQGLRSATFGMVKVTTHDTIDSALDYCRVHTGTGRLL